MPKAELGESRVACIQAPLIGMCNNFVAASFSPGTVSVVDKIKRPQDRKAYIGWSRPFSFKISVFFFPLLHRISFRISLWILLSCLELMESARLKPARHLHP